MMPLDQVLPPSAAVTPEGHLSIGGCDLVELAEEHGTPLVVYDEGALRATARAYREAFEALAPDAEVIYASKAYFGQAMLRLAREEGLSVDVASGGELYAALRAGFAPGAHLHARQQQGRARDRRGARRRRRHDRSSTTSTRSRCSSREAAARGRAPARARAGDARREALHPLLHLDRAARLEVRLLHRGRARRARRSTPCARPRALDLAGLHCHIGSQLFDLSGYGAAAAIVADFAASCGGDDLGVMDMGGGLGIAYTRADRPAAVEDYAEAVVEAVQRRVGARRPADAAHPGGARAAASWAAPG